jgi:hypothetical protein
MIKKAILITGLLIAGFITAFIIWFLVFLPVRILKPLAFTPVELHEKDFESAENKISIITAQGTTVTFTVREAAALLKTSIEKEPGVPVTDLLIEPRHNGITAIFMTKISDILSTGYLAFLLRKRNTEYTSTLISADVTASKGGLMYRINDF